MTPNALIAKHEQTPTSTALAAIDDFLRLRLASPTLKQDQKDMTKLGIKHLKQAITEAGLPIEEFVAKDGLAPYVERNLKGRSKGYVEHLRDIWRQALRDLCRRGLLALAYDRCVVPAKEKKDPHNFDGYERGYPEAWLGVYPRSLIPPPTLRAIEANESVPDGVRQDFMLVQENTDDLKRDATRVVYWFLIREMALDMKLGSVKELCSEEGALRLMDYFLAKGYHRQSNTIRKIKTIFCTLNDVAAYENPFSLKRWVGKARSWAIHFAKLPEEAPNQRYFRLNGKRHFKDKDGMIGLWLQPNEVEKIGQYGNPALKDWDGLSPEELEERFREAQEIGIARSVLFYPPRPMELWALNWNEWAPIEGDEKRDGFVLMNNARPHKRKTRPDRVVPRTYIHELEQLYKLRRAAFVSKGDIDQRASFEVGLLRPGVPLWVHPKTGARLTRPCMKRAFRAALLRIGIKPSRARRASIYWIRKGHETYARNHSKGLGDKFLSEQAGHSEVIMRKHYDSPDLLARYEHFRDHVWAPLGVVPAPKPQAAIEKTPSYAPSPIQYIDGAGLSRLAAELLARGGTVANMDAAELDRLTAESALRAGLLATFQEAAATLGIDIRTIERWEQAKIVRALRLDGRRYILKAQVNEIAQSLSPEEAGKHIGLTGRQVRNLIHDGKLPGAIPLGKNWLIPWPTVTAYQTGRAR